MSVPARQDHVVVTAVVLAVFTSACQAQAGPGAESAGTVPGEAAGGASAPAVSTSRIVPAPATSAAVAPAPETTRESTPETSPESLAEASPEGGWIVYESDEGGFSAEVPASWAPEASIEAGAVVVSLGPTGDGPAIVVRVLAPADAPIPDMPNVRCLAIEVGGLAAVRCRDTVSGGDSTTVLAPGRMYDIVSLGKRSTGVYEHFLDSFRVVQPR